MQEVFEKIYSNNEWGYGSGHGSLPKHTIGYISFLQTFIRDHNIKSVVDIGCGDWQFSQFINWEGVNYKGYDIVRSVVNNNKNAYKDRNIEFHHYSGKPADLPSGDLLLAKDVLQHWSHKTINELLINLPKYKYSLITNCVNPQMYSSSDVTEIDRDVYSILALSKIISHYIIDLIKYKCCAIMHCSHPRLLTTNLDINDGDFSYFDLRRVPFEIDAKEVYSFTDSRPACLPLRLFRIGFLKKVLLIDNTGWR